MKRIIYLTLSLCLLGQNLSIKPSDASNPKLLELKNSVMAKLQQNLKITKELQESKSNDIKSNLDKLQSRQTQLNLQTQIIDESTQALEILNQHNLNDELSIEFRNFFNLSKEGTEISKNFTLKHIEWERKKIENNNKCCVIN